MKKQKFSSDSDIVTSEQLWAMFKSLPKGERRDIIKSFILIALMMPILCVLFYLSILADHA